MGRRVTFRRLLQYCLFTCSMVVMQQARILRRYASYQSVRKHTMKVPKEFVYSSNKTKAKALFLSPLHHISHFSALHH